jgi:hypothetical protein
MSSQKKIVIKKPASATAEAAPVAVAAAASAPKSKVVVKASASQRVVSAPAKKVVVRQIVEEVEEEEEVVGPKTPQQIYDEIQVLLAQLVQVSGGKKMKGLKKDGTPRAKRTNTSGWNAFVSEFRAENPGVSWKDAMVLCKAEWATLNGKSAPEEVEESSVASPREPAAAPKPASAPKKLVIAAKKPAAAAAAPPVKTAAELMAQAMAEAAAEAEKAAAESAVEVEEFEWEGQTLQKNAEGFCWRVDEEGEQIFVGRWDEKEEKMDEKAEEPTYESASA